MQSRSGGLASSSSLNRSDSVQTTTYMISPTAQHQFGDYGTARIGATLSQSMNDAQSSIASNSPFVEPISSTPLTTKEARASFRTGEFLGQTAAELHTLISQKNGGGALRNSSRNSTALDVERYLDRQWTLLTSIGVEDIRYSGLTPRRFNNVTWSGGARWIPNADSSITVSYGRHDAGTSLMVDANYAATSRIRLSVNYSEGISSGQEDAQNALSSASINSAGQLINRQTGLPIYTNSAYFGTQTNSAYRYKRAFGSATLLLDRTVFTVSLRKDDQTLLSAATTAAPGAISGTFGTLAMQRELSPAINASVFIEVGQRQTPGLQAAVGRRSSSQDSLSLGGMLSVALSETLAARMQYSFTNLSSPTPGLSQTQNLVLLGLHKNF
jgi:uncharacterized protein (PEP-CTERM system associated)